MLLVVLGAYSIFLLEMLKQLHYNTKPPYCTYYDSPQVLQMNYRISYAQPISK